MSIANPTLSPTAPLDRRAPLLAGTAAALLLAACSVGDGSGKKSSPNPGTGQPGGPGAPISVQVLEEYTFLAMPQDDVRTNHLLRFRASFVGGGPVLGLGPQNFLFIRDGGLSTVENSVLPTEQLAKLEVSLLLDNSASIAFAPDGTPTPQNVELLRQGAIGFVDSLALSARRLNLYRFSVSSKTERIGTYLSAPGGWLASLETGNTPQQDIALKIQPSLAEDKGTALFQAVQLALEDDPDKNDVLVLFSDGREEGSKPGSKAAVLAELEAHPRLGFAIGVGDVDPEELALVASSGGVYVGSTFEAIQDLFDQVSKEVQSIYTVLYDTPLQEGDYQLELIVAKGDDVSAPYLTSFKAGVDLAKGGYQLPLIPGTEALYRDGEGVLITQRVLPLSEAYVSQATDFLCPAWEWQVEGDEPLAGDRRTHQSQGVAVEHEGLFATLLPPRPELGNAWPALPDPRFGGPAERRVAAIEAVDVPAGSFPEALRVETRSVATGALLETHWFGLGTGLLRWVEGADGPLELELYGAPSAGSTF